MEESRRWVVVVVAALAIITLILLARGEPGRGEPTQATAGVQVSQAAA